MPPSACNNRSAPPGTRAHTLDTATYNVSESGGLTYFASSLSCFNDNVFFFNDTATTEIYTLSLHDALPISGNVVVATGDTIVCTFTNTRNQGSIELNKVWSGTGGQIGRETGRERGEISVVAVSLKKKRSPPLRTGAHTIDTATYNVSESGGLTNYASSLSCFNDNGLGNGGLAGDGIQNGTEPAVS